LREIILEVRFWKRALDSSLEIMSKAFVNFKHLSHVRLNFSEMGDNYFKMSSKSVESVSKLISSLTKVQNLEMDMHHWNYATDANMEQLSKSFASLKLLTHLNLNMNGWGDAKNKLTAKSVHSMAKLIESIPQIEYLNLNMWEWSIASDGSIELLSKAFLNHKRLISLTLNLNNWGHSNPQVTVKSIESMVRLI
jgi:Ran GTPase-activating protein (RanGAP) involved in mRNA processing and transport